MTRFTNSLLPNTKLGAPVGLCLALVGMFCVPMIAKAQQGGAVSRAAGFDLDAGVPELCILSAVGSQNTSSRVASDTSGPIGNSLTISELVDPFTLTTRSTTGRLSFEAACNYPHQVRIVSRNNGLLRDGGGISQSIAWAVPYRAVLTWGNSSLSLTADALSQGARVVSQGVQTPKDGALTIDFQIDTGATNLGPNRPLGAGQYWDVISVEVGPL